MATLDHRVRSDGYAIVRGVLAPNEVDRLSAAVEVARAMDSSEAVSNSSGVFGLRNLAEVVPEVEQLTALTTMQRLLEELFEQPAFLVRATLFDKTAGANWGVFWHQDRSIAVREKHTLPGFSGWTRKAGVSCVRPPVEIMERVRAIRLHLDHCGKEQGALRVLPGTHRLRVLSDADARRQEQHRRQVLCDVCAGDAVVMCPLLLHASSPMTTGNRRRVIHLEFADFELPGELEWFHSNPLEKSA